MSSVFIAFMGMKFIFRSPYSGIFTNISFEKLFLLHRQVFLSVLWGYLFIVCWLALWVFFFFGKSLVILILLVLYIKCVFLPSALRLSVSLSLIFSNFIMLFFVVFFLFLPIAWEYLSFLGMSVQFSSNVLFKYLNTLQNCPLWMLILFRTVLEW